MVIKSDNCGPVIAESLYKYIDWMDTIIFPKPTITTPINQPPPIITATTKPDTTQTVFRDPDLDLHDACTFPDGEAGFCVLFTGVDMLEKCSTHHGIIICDASEQDAICCPKGI